MNFNDKTVIVTGGDGDGYSIGGNHFLHACRRNVDMTYIVMDNHVYGMTKGQASPTTEPDWDNKLSPGGTGIRSFHPLVIALAAGANFIGRGFSGDPNGTAAIIARLQQAQASIDAYGSLKLLHGAGLSPVLAPLDHDLEPAQAPLQQVVQAVTDCARRHLGYAVDTWPLENWATRVQASAQVMPVTEHLLTHERQRGQRHTAPGARQLAAHTPWS